MTATTARVERGPRPDAGRIAWVVFAATFLTVLGAAGFRAAPGVMLDPLHHEFGWSKATISVAVSVNLVLYGLMGPVSAALMGRYGLRVVVTSALVLVAASSVATIWMTQPWHYVLAWGVGVGVGSGCVATMLAAAVASRWFVAHRGLVTGALTAAAATGQLIFLPLFGYLAEEVSWHWVAASVAIGALAVVPLVVGFIRNSPAEIGRRPVGAPVDYEAPALVANPLSAAGSALTTAWRSGAFWLLAGSFFVCGASTNGLIGTHYVSAAGDHGVRETVAASSLALIGVFDIVGTVLSGWLTDRMDPRKLLLVYYALRGLSLVALDLALDAQGAGLIAFIVFYGLDWVATVPPTVALCAEVFGPQQGPLVFGWVLAGHQMGAGAMALFAGASHDWTGSYLTSFLVAGALCGVAAIGVLRIDRTPRPSAGPVPTGGRQLVSH